MCSIVEVYCLVQIVGFGDTNLIQLVTCWHYRYRTGLEDPLQTTSKQLNDDFWKHLSYFSFHSHQVYENIFDFASCCFKSWKRGKLVGSSLRFGAQLQFPMMFISSFCMVLMCTVHFLGSFPDACSVFHQSLHRVLNENLARKNP